MRSTVGIVIASPSGAGDGAAGSAPAAPSRRAAVLLRGWSPYLFLLPAVALVLLLLLAPIASTAYVSLTNSNGITAPQFIGIANYEQIAGDSNFQNSVFNTLIWLGATLVLPVGIGLLVACLTSGLRGQALYRLPFLLPYGFAPTVVALMSSFILLQDGLLNQMLSAVGLSAVARPWLLDVPYNTLAMIAASTWQGVGISVILFLVGLQSIPRAPIEAALIDGARGWTLFRDMTWPLLRPMTIVVIGISIVSALNRFDLLWVMTRGGPYRSSETLAVTMYQESFVLFHQGYGAAIAVLLGAIVVTVSLVYLRGALREAQ